MTNKKGLPDRLWQIGKRLTLWLVTTPLVFSSCFSGHPGQSYSGNKVSGDKNNLPDSLRIDQIAVPDNATYCAILDELDKNNLQNINRSLILFSNNKADSLSRDSMFVAMNEFMTTVIQGYYDKKLMGNRKLIDHFQSKEDPAEAKRLVASLATHGINLAFRDGDFYLEPNLEFVYKKLNQVLTTTSRDYLQIKINISKGFTSGQNQRVSTPDSLAIQIVTWEDFLTKYPDYLLAGDIQAQYIDVFASYLSGTEHVPLFDPSTKMLDPKFQHSYLRYLEDYPNRESTKIVKKFYDLLVVKEFKYNESLDSFLSEVDFISPQSQP